MQSNTTEAAVKAKAKALRRRLQQMNVVLTHQQALEAVAALEGEKDWGALGAKQPVTLNRAQVETMLRHRSPLLAAERYGREPVVWLMAFKYYAPHFTEPGQAKRHADEYVQGLLDEVFGPKEAGVAYCEDASWLQMLEETVRRQGKSEIDLDELIYEVAGDRAASDINNQGMRRQLEVLYAHHYQFDTTEAQAREAVLADLSQHLDISLSADANPLTSNQSRNPNTMDGVHLTIKPLKQLLDAGFAPEGIRLQAEKHLKDLQALGPQVEGRDEAIAATREFIASLPAVPADE